ncbi:hypothetical protein ABEX78_23980 [Priestia megaterium]
MIISLGWKNLQKKYMDDKFANKTFKNKVQRFMTEAILETATDLKNGKIQFIFLFNGKRYVVELIKNHMYEDLGYICGIKRSTYMEFGSAFQPEILPYLKEYKQRYMTPVYMLG